MQFIRNSAINCDGVVMSFLSDERLQKLYDDVKKLTGELVTQSVDLENECKRKEQIKYLQNIRAGCDQVSDAIYQLDKQQMNYIYAGKD